MSQVDDLVHNIAIRCPTFTQYWAQERSAYSDETGHITLCGMFFVLSDYLSSHFATLTTEQHESLWEWVEWQASSGNEELSTAAVTCFLEGIAETDVEQRCRQFMPSRLKQWLDDLMHRGRHKKRWFEN